MKRVSFNARSKISSALTPTTLLSTVYPSFIDALPSQARAPILDTISALQYRLAEYIAAMLKSEETAAAIALLSIDRLTNCSRAASATRSATTSFNQVLRFIEDRFARSG